MIIVEKAGVKKYFEQHPECYEAIKGITVQTKFPYQAEAGEDIDRPLDVSDIVFITNEGWESQKGIFAWYYPLGIPHYCKISD